MSSNLPALSRRTMHKILLCRFESEPVLWPDLTLNPLPTQYVKAQVNSQSSKS